MYCNCLCVRNKKKTPSALGKSPPNYLSTDSVELDSVLWQPKVQNRKLRFFKTTLIINPSLHQTKQFLCVILAKELNGFQEPLLEQSVLGILIMSETLSGSDIKNNYVHGSYLPHTRVRVSSWTFIYLSKLKWSLSIDNGNRWKSIK